ncbi:MAG: M64 family metallopeptidase [Planctomycetota bacterium]
MSQGSPGAPAESIRIEVDDEGRRIQIDYAGDQLLRLGRSPECDIVLATAKASRIHAEIFGEGGIFTLLDRASANGTYLNGVRVNGKSPLVRGDEIRIGEARIQFGPRPDPEVSGAAASVRAANAPVGETPVSPTRPAARRSRPSPGRRAAQLGLPLVLIAVMGYVIWRVVDAPPPRPAEPREGSARLASQPPPRDPHRIAPAIDPSASRPASEAVPAEQSTTDDDPEAWGALRALRYEVRSGALGWDVIVGLENLERLYPESRAAVEAKQWASLLADLRHGVDAAERQRAETELRALVAAGRYGDAIAAAGLLARLDEHGAASWQARAREVVGLARSELQRVERTLSELLLAGNPTDALRTLLDVRRRFSGTDLYDDLLPRYVDAALAGAGVTPVAALADREISSLRAGIAQAFDQCRFRDLTPYYYRVLGLDPPPDEKIEALRGLVESFYLERLFENFLASAAGRDFAASLSEDYPSRVVRVTDREVEIELDVAGRPVKEVYLWERLSAAQKYGLFRSVPLPRDAVLGLAYFALRTGYVEGAERALIRLLQNRDSRDLVDAILAEYRGIPIPSGGFVEYRGRLVTPAERDADVARRERQQAEEREALAELKRLEREGNLSGWIGRAVALRKAGNFESAHKILGEIVRKARATEAGAEAQRLLDDPILAAHDRLIHGPDENRLDIVFLGDGYPIENDYQEAFLNHVAVCQRLFLGEEPYREYQSYLNLRAVQLGSRDRGLDRLPRGDPKDTALDGKVEWDVITMNPGRVREILQRVYGESSDGLAICIGNDTAGVATGGGGVVSLAKGGLVPVGHEVGHALGGLLDEYTYTPGNDPQRPVPKERRTNVPTEARPPNVMLGSDRDDVLANAIWSYWIEAGESKWWNGSLVSVFEGANLTPFNAWRPQSDCKMRNAGSRFCVVCMEQMVLSIYRYVRPIDAFEPEAAELSIPASGELRLFVYPLKPETHYLDARWYVADLGVNPPASADLGDDGAAGRGLTGVDRSRPDRTRGELYRRTYRGLTPEGRVVEAAELRAQDLEPGYYRVTCEISDPTPWVIRDEEGLLRQTHEWVVQVVK